MLLGGMPEPGGQDRSEWDSSAEEQLWVPASSRGRRQTCPLQTAPRPAPAGDAPEGRQVAVHPPGGRQAEQRSWSSRNDGALYYDEGNEGGKEKYHIALKYGISSSLGQILMLLLPVSAPCDATEPVPIYTTQQGGRGGSLHLTMLNLIKFDENQSSFTCLKPTQA